MGFRDVQECQNGEFGSEIAPSLLVETVQEILRLNFQCNSIKHAVVLQNSLGQMRPVKYLEKLSLIMKKVSVNGL